MYWVITYTASTIWGSLKCWRKRVYNALKTALERAQATNQIIAGDNNSRVTLLMGLTMGLNIAARTCSNGSEITELSAAIGSQLKSWKT
jgi:hypothetical protein